MRVAILESIVMPAGHEVEFIRAGELSFQSRLWSRYSVP